MMARELNISLIIGIVVAILPVWQWDSGIELLILSLIHISEPTRH